MLKLKLPLYKSGLDANFCSGKNFECILYHGWRESFGLCYFLVWAEGYELVHGVFLTKVHFRSRLSTFAVDNVELVSWPQKSP